MHEDRSYDLGTGGAQLGGAVGGASVAMPDPAATAVLDEVREDCMHGRSVTVNSFGVDAAFGSKD